MQQLRWLLGGGVTLLSVATVFYLDVAAWFLVALTSVAVLVGLAQPAWLARVPRWVHRLAFPVVAAFFAADLWMFGELLPAIVRLDILLLLYRSLMYRQKRDDLQLVVLGLFLVVVTGVLSVSVTFVLHILAFVGCGLLFLLVITLSSTPGATVESAGEAPAWTRQVKWGQLLGRVRQATDWRVVALGGGLFVGLVVLSGLLFLAIPRFQLESGFFLERFMTKKARSGFSDTIRFGEVTEITQDNSVALRVDVSDRASIPAAPYWRMMVLDEYREGTFRLSRELSGGAFGRERSRVEYPAGVQSREGVAFWTFYLESGVSRYLPLLGPFQRLQFRDRQNYRYSTLLRVLALRDDPVAMTAYRVEGMTSTPAVADREFGRLLAQNPVQGIPRLMTSLRVGEADRRAIERVVAEIKGSGGEGLPVPDFARRAEAWLGQRHRYTLSPRIPGGEGDSLVRWLVSNEAGHCELFAGSMVLLARAAGIPARVVTGFRGGSWNGYSNNFTLRNADAHAWVELFDAQSESWLRADATPGATTAANNEAAGEAGLAGRLDRSWTARLDSLRVFWYRRVVSFDQQSQIETFRAVKDATEVAGERLRAALERIRARVKAWIAAPTNERRTIWPWAIGVALVLLIALLRRFDLPVFGFRFHRAPSNPDRVRAEAGKWLGRLRALNARDDVEVRETIAALERLRFGPSRSWERPALVFRGVRRVWREAKRRASKRVTTS
jgi:transglutaminase-like putative cysteine protease